jgi:hypothetical protein
MDEKIKIKLKNAYKNAKIAKKKQREAAREAHKEALAAAGASVAGSSGPGTKSAESLLNSPDTASKIQPMSLALNKMKGLDAIGEEDEEDEFSEGMDDEEYIDPVQVEINSAFETFAASASDFTMRLAQDDLRPAIIQLVNKALPHEFVNRAVRLADIVANPLGFDIEEFSAVYYRYVFAIVSLLTLLILFVLDFAGFSPCWMRLS